MPPKRRSYSGRRRRAYTPMKKRSYSRRRPARFATKYGKRRRALITRPIRQTANPVPKKAAKVGMKLYQGSFSNPCSPPDSGLFYRVDITNSITEGAGNRNRLGTKIMVHRFDLVVNCQSNPFQAIPQEYVQFVLWRTKQLLSSGEITDFREMFSRPAGSTASYGTGVLSTGGTVGVWPAKFWVKNPFGVPQATVMAVKNFTVFSQGSIQTIAAGTGGSVPNASQTTAAASVNINSVHPYRQTRKYIFNFRKPIRVNYAPEGPFDSLANSDIVAARAGADNHFWFGSVGECQSDFSAGFQVAYNIWFTDN